MRFWRRRDRFAALAEASAPMDVTPDADLEHLERVRKAVEGVSPAPFPGGRYDEQLRLRLVASVERQGDVTTPQPDAAPPQSHATPRELRRPPPRLRAWWKRRGRLHTVTVMVTTAALGVALAGATATSYTPGSPLYGVKRGVERVELSWTHSDLGRGTLLLTHATRRLWEAGKAIGQPDTLKGLLGDMDSATVEGTRLVTTVALDTGDTAPLETLNEWQAHQQQELEALLHRGQRRATVHASNSLALLQRLSERVGELDRGVRCGSPVLASDELGPVPKACPPQPGTTTRLPGNINSSLAPNHDE